MAFCQYCGSKLPENAKFCTECGGRVEMNREPVAVEPFVQPLAEPEKHQSFASAQDSAAFNYSAPETAYRADPYANAKQSDKTTRVVLLSTVALLGLGILLLLCLFITNLLKAAPQGADDAVGRYEAQSYTVSGTEFEAAGEWIELQTGGKARVGLMGNEYAATWERSGEKLTISQGDDTFSGTVRQDAITVDFGGYVFTFLREGSTAPTVRDETAPQAPAQTQPQNKEKVDTSDLLGNWYGWWVITEGTGSWEEFADSYWAACAQIDESLEEPGTGSFVFWDEDSQEDECISDSAVRFVTGESGAIMIPESGFFWDQDLEGGEWSMEYIPMEKGVDILWISGTYVDPANSDESFSYSIFLRPWGESWDDVRDMDTTNMPYDDMMPALYEEWYLPKIKDGKEMPASFINMFGNYT